MCVRGMEYQARKLSSHEICVLGVWNTKPVNWVGMYMNVSGMEYQARKLSSHEICVLGVWNTKPGNWVVMKYVC